MGDANKNPRSIQFKGALPENILGARIEAISRPTKEWEDAHPAVEGEDPPVPGPEDMEVAYVLMATWVFPQRTVKMKDWPVGEVPMATLATIPVNLLKARVDIDLIEKGHKPAPSILVDE